MPPLNRKASTRLAASVKLTPRVLNHETNPNSQASRNTSYSRNDPTDYALHMPSNLPKARQPRGASKAGHLSNHHPQVVLSDGLQYYQKANLPWNVNNATGAGIVERPSSLRISGLDETEMPHDTSPQTDVHMSNSNRHQRKKNNQWNTWITQVIPSLVVPVLTLFSSTESLRYPPRVPDEIFCHCGHGTQRLKVMCIYWQEIRNIQVTICHCSSVSVLLLEHALFPCAPSQPSLAVDLNMLEFLTELNNRQAPNNSAWCHTLIHFYKMRMDNVPSFDSLRKRFTNALLWYSVLINATQKYMDNLMRLNGEGREPRMGSGTSDEVSSASHPSDERNLSLQVTSLPDVPSSPNITANNILGNSLGRAASETSPSELNASTYLRSRCPCCFGSQFENNPPEMSTGLGPEALIPDVIVQIDANFSQKRRHGANDPSLSHPYTIFLADNELNAMEDYIEGIRGRGGPTMRQPRVIDSEDHLEVTGLPSSVLDACEATFEAADSRRHKASTKFFSNTGTMAILCRHENVLFMANMTSAGEKQFYAFALIKAVISNLPTHTTLGVLYDIGCQIHRSVVKWNLFPELQSRLTFAISVFHAYGHEWPCQLIYNPWKCVGFGFSDGEGCERLWSSIKELIPNLRVTGHHKRLYILDDRIEFDRQLRLWRTGLWLRRAYTEAENKFASADMALRNISSTEDELRKEWKLQLLAQTKPLPCQSKNKAQNIIQATLRIWQQMTTCQDEIRELESQSTRTPAPSDHLNAISPEEINIMLEDVRNHLERLTRSYENKMKALGLTERRQLEAIKSNEYLNLRMNLRAKKQRIRERIRRRKFELSRLVKASSHSITERKLVDHSEKMITRREPTILRLVSDYNKGCSRLEELIRRRHVPHGVQTSVPIKIDPKKIFSTEMDDSIWQDVGLEDNSDDIPGWLGDDDVRKGILALLSKDRSLEELNQIEKEVKSVQTWIFDIILSISRCMEQFRTTDTMHLTYAFKKRFSWYKSLYKHWACDLCKIPGFQQNVHLSILELLELSDETSQTEWEVMSESGSDVSCMTDRSFQENCHVLDTLEMLELGEDKSGPFDVDVENQKYGEMELTSISGIDHMGPYPFADSEYSRTPIAAFANVRLSTQWESDNHGGTNSRHSPQSSPTKRRKVYHHDEKREM